VKALAEDLLTDYRVDISKIKDLSKLLKNLGKSLKDMKHDAIEKYDAAKIEILRNLELQQINEEKEKSAKENILNASDKPKSNSKVKESKIQNGSPKSTQQSDQKISSRKSEAEQTPEDLSKIVTRSCNEPYHNLNLRLKNPL